jgi:hypothetical protein
LKFDIIFLTGESPVDNENSIWGGKIQNQMCTDSIKFYLRFNWIYRGFDCNKNWFLSQFSFLLEEIKVLVSNYTFEKLIWSNQELNCIVIEVWWPIRDLIKTIWNQGLNRKYSFEILKRRCFLQEHYSLSSSKKVVFSNKTGILFAANCSNYRACFMAVILMTITTAGLSLAYRSQRKTVKKWERKWRRQRDRRNKTERWGDEIEQAEKKTEREEREEEERRNNREGNTREKRETQS